MIERFRRSLPLVLLLPLAACATGVRPSGEAGPPVAFEEEEAVSAPVQSGDRFGAALDLQRQGLLDEAAGEWRALLDSDPDHGRAHARLAAVLDLLGDEEGAREHAEEARRRGEPVPVLASSLETAKAAAAATPQIGPQVRVDGGGYSIEPAALTTEAAPSRVFASWYDTRQIPGTPETLTRQVLATSTNGGQTWTETLLDPASTSSTTWASRSRRTSGAPGRLPSRSASTPHSSPGRDRTASSTSPIGTWRTGS